MAEFISALHDPSLSVVGKLKVARYLWQKGNLLPAERNALMLKWACQELCSAYSKKNKVPPPHVTRGRLWGCLYTVLEALVEEGEMPQDLTPLSSHLFQVMWMLVDHTYVCTEVGGADPCCREWVWLSLQQPLALTIVMWCFAL